MREERKEWRERKSWEARSLEGIKTRSLEGEEDNEGGKGDVEGEDRREAAGEEREKEEEEDEHEEGGRVEEKTEGRKAEGGR